MLIEPCNKYYTRRLQDGKKPIIFRIFLLQARYMLLADQAGAMQAPVHVLGQAAFASQPRRGQRIQVWDRFRQATYPDSQQL